MTTIATLINTPFLTFGKANGRIIPIIARTAETATPIRLAGVPFLSETLAAVFSRYPRSSIVFLSDSILSAVSSPLNLSP